MSALESYTDDKGCEWLCLAACRGKMAQWFFPFLDMDEPSWCSTKRGAMPIILLFN